MNEEAGAPVALTPGVRRILAGNPGLMTGAGTNTYLLGDREVAVLDPGPDDSTHLRHILAAAGPLIRWVIVTHTHAYHSPLAARLARESGARLIGLPPPRDWSDPASVTFCHEVGLDYVSCSPFRVPIARLAAAQAALGKDAATER